nr:polysaccharide deacetylase family protein [Marinigracilibium pacificum]
MAYHTFGGNTVFEEHLKHLNKSGIQFIITVDDGDYSFYEIAFPLIKKYKIPSILFIIPSLIDTDNPFWWDEYYYYAENGGSLSEINWLKSIPNKERINFLSDLKAKSQKKVLRKKQLTTDQLLEMQDNGVIIANHSFTHPMFDQCSAEELRYELSSAKEFFIKNGLNGYDIFAYPNGNFNEESELVLKEFGIKYAFLFDHKVNGRIDNPLRISRLSVNDSTPLTKFKFILSGWHSRLLPYIKAGYKLIN